MNNVEQDAWNSMVKEQPFLIDEYIGLRICNYKFLPIPTFKTLFKSFLRRKHLYDELEQWYGNWAYKK